MKKKDLKALDSLWTASQKIVITSHYNPDGDAVGSSLGLFHYLKAKGHEVFVVLPNEFPDFLAWMPGSNDILFATRDKETALQKLKAATVIFSLDYNAPSRTEHMKEALLDNSALKVLIDHHREPEDFADAILWDVEASSTCELIYRFINHYGDTDFIDQNIAACLYAGIMTDTGSFKYASTSPQTHKIAARLMETGIEASEIHSMVFDTNSYSRMQLLGRALENLQVIPAFQTAYTQLTKAELEEFNFVKGDTEGFVNYGLALKGVHFSVIFIENQQEPYIKISFRSKGDFDVNTFARKYFNGGGHQNAAGGKSMKNMTETIEDFKKALQEYAS
ncbi:MAG: bifunctional oligoribonuclease/PAP phosphatase NrnA [Bacteroidetes bacterium]|nr:bifunctional oligoribonuclease/PAP phosphatase NrnA [Bacteroidota bacterium]